MLPITRWMPAALIFGKKSLLQCKIAEEYDDSGRFARNFCCVLESAETFLLAYKSFLSQAAMHMKLFSASCCIIRLRFKFV